MVDQRQELVDLLADGSDAEDGSELWAAAFGDPGEASGSSASAPASTLVKRETAGQDDSDDDNDADSLSKSSAREGQAPTSAKQDTPAKKSKGSASSLKDDNETPSKHPPLTEPAKKICCGCDASALDLTAMDVEAGCELRQWALPHHWGSLCMWCHRMARVRFAFMRKSSITKWLNESSSNKLRFKLCSLAFVSLRAEGRIQLSPRTIDDRVDTLMRFGKLVWGSMDPNACLMQYVLMEDFATGPIVVNLVVEGRVVVQLMVRGERRLGFAVPCPKTTQPSGGLPANVLAAEGLATDRSDDLRVLADLAEAATREREAKQIADEMHADQESLGKSDALGRRQDLVREGAPLCASF